MAGKTMRAVVYECYGGGSAALKHVEIPIPSPTKDEILLKLEATSLNPLDWRLQEGMLRPFLPFKFPFISGFDLVGEVTEVGSAVKTFKAGDKVLSPNNPTSGGGLAEYAVTSAQLAVIRPPQVSAAEAAGLPIAGSTALQALKAAGVKFNGTDKPANILVTAASGGVGHYVVQLAKLVGLHVTATCGARNLDLVRGLGADEVVDYKTPEGVKLKSPTGRIYDLVIHCAPAIPWSTFAPNLTENGMVVEVTPSRWTFLHCALRKVLFLKKRLFPLFLLPKVEDLRFLVEMVNVGKLKTVVDSTHPLSKTEEAWAASMSGHATGKIIVEM